MLIFLFAINLRFLYLLNRKSTGKSKEEVISELKAYVQESVDFISEYNQTHKIDGKGVISSVDLFNEIISFDEPYKNMWQELYGISNEELVEIFQYAQEHKPEGVTYVYNEPFLENSERRKAVLEQLQQINELLPNLIDTIGTQMHIEMTQDTESIRQCFEDLKKSGFKTQITEFDMCLPERFMFDDKGKIRSEDELVQIINSKLEKSGISIENIADYKSIRMQQIASIIKETGIELEGVTYWSTIARDSKKFKTKYKMRTEVERLNGRIDRDYMFNDHFIRGQKKMELMLDLSFLVMLTMAKGHIKNEQKNIRSLAA